MFWKRRHNVIHVEFFDAGTGEKFAESLMPFERLPASFEGSTTLEFRGDQWQGERADPMTGDGFRKSGRLRLVLRKQKITNVDPHDVLFSLPTISNEFPPVAPGSSKLG